MSIFSRILQELSRNYSFKYICMSQLAKFTAPQHLPDTVFVAMYCCIYNFNSTLFYASTKNQIIFLYPRTKKKRIRGVTVSQNSVSISSPLEMMHTHMHPVWMKPFWFQSSNKPALSNPHFRESSGFYAIRDIILSLGH